MVCFLFVYGTLLKDFGSDMAIFLEQNAQFVAKGFFYGKLFHVSWYPGAILSENTNDKVHGHVYKIINPEKTFKILDAYEGIEASQQSEYIRTTLEVHLENNSPLKTWAYLYNLPTTHLECIKSGSYV